MSAIGFAVTTTDSGNPWCNDTSPEGGALRATSCQERASEFTANGSEPVDAFDVACGSVCEHATVEVVPTPTVDDPQPRARPWIEGGAAGTNLADVSAQDALACLLPQGVDGCHFEQPLESMYRAIVRARFDDEPSFGFLRPSSVAGVIVLTDAVDCSYDPDQVLIFLPDGDRHLWSDPDADAPTAALCWNAGVQCQGEGSAYDECESSRGYLRDMDRYIDLLQEVEDDAAESVGEPREVLFATLGGVAADGEVVYADAPDEASMIRDGIGPGCVSSDGAALPPVRLREVAEAFALDDEAPALASICEGSYETAIATIADRLLDRLAAPCVSACVRDRDPDTPGLQSRCEVTIDEQEDDGSTTTSEIPPCEDGLPPGADMCWRPLTGEALSDRCAAQGWNLELDFVYADGVAMPSGARVTAACELSDDEAGDCPTGRRSN